MMLGTVQFGMPYGVANRFGQPSFHDVLKMLEAAVAGGVNCADTAAAYGTSEEVLGKAVRELKLQDSLTIVTKVHWLTPEQLADHQLATDAIIQSVDQSRRRLQIDCLPVVLFHRESDAVYMHVLEDLRHRGWLNHMGVSCDNRPGPAAQFVQEENVTALQIPCNLMDPRHLNSGVFTQASERDVAVFVRSVYLQGLLTMAESEIPVHLQPVIPARRQLEHVAREAGMRLNELAVRFMLSQAGVTCVLTGIETLDQVQDNLAIFDRGPLPSDVLTSVTATIPQLAEALVTPSQWPSLAAARTSEG